MHASFEGYTEIVQLILEKGSDVNAKDSNGRTAMLVSFIWGNSKEAIEKVMRLLIKKGADVNAKFVNGDTALTLAK